MIYTRVSCFQDVLNFGRSGAGAPVRDSQGQVRAVVVGNPEIRSVKMKKKPVKL